MKVLKIFFFLYVFVCGKTDKKIYFLILFIGANETFLLLFFWVFWVNHLYWSHSIYEPQIQWEIGLLVTMGYVGIADFHDWIVVTCCCVSPDKKTLLCLCMFHKACVYKTMHATTLLIRHTIYIIFWSVTQYMSVKCFWPLLSENYPTEKQNSKWKTNASKIFTS